MLYQVVRDLLPSRRRFREYPRGVTVYVTLGTLRLRVSRDDAFADASAPSVRERRGGAGPREHAPREKIPSGEEVEGVLHPVFQEDELTLILVGAFLGLLAGFAQAAFF